MINGDELAAYVHASKGSLVRAFLLMLDAGIDFNDAVCGIGEDGLKISMGCLLKGWIDRGKVTNEGREFLRSGADA